MDTTWENEARAAQDNLEMHCDGQAKRYLLDMGARHNMLQRNGPVGTIIATLSPTLDKKEEAKQKAASN